MRRALGLGKVHLLGHSWGGWLAIEYALTYPEALKTLILEDTAADLPHLMQEMHRLRSALGTETVEMLLAHEADGSYHHPEYQAAITLMNYRHVCRLSIWPKPLMASLNDWNVALYGDAGAERVPLYRQPQGLEPHRRSAAHHLPGADHRRQARRDHPGLRAAHEAGARAG